ncbi:peroxiredoxin-like family protein [Pseudomonadota bacterium]
MKKFVTCLILVLFMGFSVLIMAADDREDIHASAEEVQPLLVGMKAPDFTVLDVENGAVRFVSGEQEKPVVLSFYRGGWCPYCNLHLSELRLAEEQLKAMGFDIWFISIDKPELLLASLDDPDIGYTVYSDSALNATRAFGLAFRVDDELNERYLSYDIDLERASGENHHVLPAPATYIIGRDGIINFAYINPDYKVRLHPNVLLAAAQAYNENADIRLVEKRKQANNK